MIWYRFVDSLSHDSYKLSHDRFAWGSLEIQACVDFLANRDRFVFPCDP